VRILALLAVFLSLAAHAEDRKAVPLFWTDNTGKRDMPWMGKGGRAKLYLIDRTKPWDIMNPRGPTIERSWGSSGGSGESPFETAQHAMEYLARIGFLDGYPSYPGEGSRPGPKAFPFRMTIVAIQPTVAILRFDLSAAIEDPIPFVFGSFPPSQRDQADLQDVGPSGTVSRVMIGTHLVDRPGTLLWFSPDLKLKPAPLDLSGGRADLALPGFHLVVARKAGELEVAWQK
jgi:hypothetical protein